jgi:hypothetical protein
MHGQELARPSVHDDDFDSPAWHQRLEAWGDARNPIRLGQQAERSGELQGSGSNEQSGHLGKPSRSSGPGQDPSSRSSYVSGLGRKPSKPYVAKKLLRERKTMTATQMASSLGVSERQSRRIMNRLVDIEFAIPTGSTKARKYHYIEGR